MNQPALSLRPWLFALLAAGLFGGGGCGSGSGGLPAGPASTGGASLGSASGAGATSGSGGGGTGGGIGTGGVLGTGGGAPPPGTGGSVGTGGASAGRGSGGSGTGGAAVITGSGGAARSGSGGAGAVVVPPNCTIPATVSFQRDVQPMLAQCGGSGCHVVDGSSTMANGGKTHAYDWITAGSHASSCPETPNPKRFQVVIAVIEMAFPPSCSRSRLMPPPGMGTPLTACQVATLQAWLNEPLVTQMHRADDSSPTTPYPMPPFN